jgi:helix-turn-helix protein
MNSIINHFHFERSFYKNYSCRETNNSIISQLILKKIFEVNDNRGETKSEEEYLIKKRHLLMYI